MLNQHFELALDHMNRVTETTVHTLVSHLERYLEGSPTSAEEADLRVMRLAYIASSHNEHLLEGAGLGFEESNRLALRARELFKNT